MRQASGWHQNLNASPAEGSARPEIACLLAPDSQPRTTAEVLVVDESATVRDVAARILNAAGFRALAVPNLPEAAALVRRALPCRTALLVSSTLARSNYSLLAELRQCSPPAAVLISCKGGVTCPLNPQLPCFDLGCLKKPRDFTAGRLAAAVRMALENSRQE